MRSILKPRYSCLSISNLINLYSLRMFEYRNYHAARISNIHPFIFSPLGGIRISNESSRNFTRIYTPARRVQREDTDISQLAAPKLAEQISKLSIRVVRRRGTRVRTRAQSLRGAEPPACIYDQGPVVHNSVGPQARMKLSSRASSLAAAKLIGERQCDA